jgi:hypothetical protein
MLIFLNNKPPCPGPKYGLGQGLKIGGYNMIGDSITLKNLQAIKDAMEKIKEIDRSDYFNQYYGEILDRLKTGAIFTYEFEADILPDAIEFLSLFPDAWDALKIKKILGNTGFVEVCSVRFTSHFPLSYFKEKVFTLLDEDSYMILDTFTEIT